MNAANDWCVAFVRMWEALQLSGNGPCVLVFGRGEQDVSFPSWGKFAQLAHPTSSFTFEAHGHAEHYTVTNDSAQQIFITAGIMLVDPPSQPDLEAAQQHGNEGPIRTGGGAPQDHTAYAVYHPGEVVKPDRLEEFTMNMTLETVRLFVALLQKRHV